VLGDAARERLLADLLALYDDYGRGMDGMQLPYLTRCYRTVVAERPEPVAVEPDPIEPRFEPTVPIALAGDDPMNDSADTIPRVAAGLDDTGTLLIDFR
jgi:hypothetical protein